jgi:hypothetical protein
VKVPINDTGTPPPDQRRSEAAEKTKITSTTSKNATPRDTNTGSSPR